MKRPIGWVVCGAMLSLACAGIPGGTETPAPPAAPPVAPAAAPAPPTPPAPPGPTSAIPYYSTPLPDSALTGRSLRELTLMRNTIYARAGNPFRKRWLNAWFSAQTWYRPAAALNESALTAVDTENAKKIAAYEAALKQSELRARIETVSARLRSELATAPQAQVEVDLIELMLLDRATGQVFPGDSGVVVPAWFADKVDVTALDDPSRLDRLLTVDELRDFSRRDLRILRNMVYARRGREFKSMLLSEYFSRMEWYRPDGAYTDARLTDVDQRNVKLIRSVEDSIGGPITDTQQQASDEWFSGA